MTKRRLGGGVVAAAVVLGLGLGACSPGNTPDEYNTLTQQNFLEACTNFYFENTDDTLAITDQTVTDAAQDPPDQSTCQCMYDVFATQMPINSAAADTIPDYAGPNFTDLNADLKSDAESAWADLPQEYKDQLDECRQDGGSGSGGDDTTTTTAADESTTTTAES